MIITGERIEHIKERHPEAYENRIEYVSRLIRNPDYIIADTKHENTGLIITKKPDIEEQLMLVLRVCVSNDMEGYKNSIISSWTISEKRLNNHLKNKKVLYKRE